MTGRPIKGEGVANEQDYIEERLEDAGDVTAYGQAAQRLKQEEQDLEQAERQIEKQPAPAGSTYQP